VTISEWLAVGGTLMGSTGLGAVAIAFVKAKQARHVVETNAVVKLLPQMQERVDTLEARIEDRDVKIECIQSELLECKQSHSECKGETQALMKRVSASESEIRKLKQSIPPRQ
jgi:chromosome segregation ATPase